MRIVPSIAVDAISRVFPWATEEAGDSTPLLKVDSAPGVGAVLAIVEGIPDELLPHQPETAARFLAAVGRIRGAMQTWGGGGHPEHLAKLGGAPELGTHPITYIIRTLRRCPDSAPTAATATLSFVTNPATRESLRADIAETHRALGTGDYKSASVLAGSIIETLLLWACQAKGATGTQKWSLFECIDGAFRLKLIGDATKDAALVAKDYRNLIHPAVVQRVGTTCTLGTAHMAVGAMEEVIRDLASRLATPLP